MLGTHFSYSEKLKQEKIFYKTVTYSTSIKYMKKEKPYI